MEQEKINKMLEQFSKVFKVENTEVKRMYDTETKNGKTAYEMNDEQAQEFAINRVFGVLKSKQLDNAAEFKAIITGTDGRSFNFAEWQKSEVMGIAEKCRKEGKTDTELIAMGIINKEGRYLYPSSDKFRAGRPIPDKDISVSFDGLVKNEKGKMIITHFSGKEVEILDAIRAKKIFKIKGTKKEKSTEKEYHLSVKDAKAITPVDDLPWVEYQKACEFVYGSKKVTFDKLVELCNNIPDERKDRVVCIGDVQVIDVKEGVGPNETVLVSTTIPNMIDNVMNPLMDEFSRINAWIPKELNFVPYQGQQISFAGSVSKADKDRGSLTINVRSVWCDEKMLRKDVPKMPEKIEEEPKEKLESW